MNTPTFEELHPNLQQWPENVPATAQRVICAGENPTDVWHAVEYYDDAGTLLSRSAHVMVKRGLSVNSLKGDF